MGFEPTVYSVTGCRGLLAPLRLHKNWWREWDLNPRWGIAPRRVMSPLPSTMLGISRDKPDSFFVGLEIWSDLTWGARSSTLQRPYRRQSLPTVAIGRCHFPNVAWIVSGSLMTGKI